MSERVLLLEIQVIAERVARFAADVEVDGSAEHRELWRAALDDLQAAIRNARAHGIDPADIRHAALGAPAAP